MTFNFDCQNTTSKPLYRILLPSLEKKKPGSRCLHESRCQQNWLQRWVRLLRSSSAIRTCSGSARSTFVMTTSKNSGNCRMMRFAWFASRIPSTDFRRALRRVLVLTSRGIVPFRSSKNFLMFRTKIIFFFHLLSLRIGTQHRAC